MGITSKAIYLLAGAGVGAIATYLLDPEEGDNRRRVISQKAEHAVAGTGDAVHEHLHRAAQSARTIAGKLNDYADQAVAHVADHVHHTASEVSDHAADAADRARSLRDHLTNRANSLYADAKRSAQQRAGVEASHPVSIAAGITMGTIGVAAIGAGAMYLLDPAKGRSRRALAVDKFMSWTHRTGKSVRGYGRHLGNQLQGTIHEVAATVPSPWSDTARKVADIASDGIHTATES